VEQNSDDADLLVQFERETIKDDYRLFYTVKRNNLFSSIQGFPEHWEFFCRLDEILRREIGDLEVSTDPVRMLPVTLYINAHAKMRISMELAFSSCMPEARSILRDAVETVAYAHYMLRDPNNQHIWMEKNEPLGRNAFKNVFRVQRKDNLFLGLSELHAQFGELSEAGSHPTMQSFANRVTMEDHDGERYMSVNYSGVPDRVLFARELFSRLLTCYVMERTFFEDFKTRLQFDAGLVSMRYDFEIFKESLRKALIVKYNVSPQNAKPVNM
jgi:hypothetical protein